jgi:hypothetical protein
MFADNQALALFPTTVWLHRLKPEDTTRIDDHRIRAWFGFGLEGPDPECSNK